MDNLRLKEGKLLLNPMTEQVEDSSFYEVDITVLYINPSKLSEYAGAPKTPLSSSGSSHKSGIRQCTQGRSSLGGGVKKGLSITNIPDDVCFEIGLPVQVDKKTDTPVVPKKELVTRSMPANFKWNIFFQSPLVPSDEFEENEEDVAEHFKEFDRELSIERELFKLRLNLLNFAWKDDKAAKKVYGPAKKVLGKKTCLFYMHKVHEKSMTPVKSFKGLLKAIAMQALVGGFHHKGDKCYVLLCIALSRRRTHNMKDREIMEDYLLMSACKHLHSHCARDAPNPGRILKGNNLRKKSHELKLLLKECVDYHAKDAKSPIRNGLLLKHAEGLIAFFNVNEKQDLLIQRGDMFPDN